MLVDGLRAQDRRTGAFICGLVSIRCRTIAVFGRLDTIGNGRGTITRGTVTVIGRPGAVAFCRRSERGRIDPGSRRLAAVGYLAKMGTVIATFCFAISERCFAVAVVCRPEPRLGPLVSRP